VANISSKIWRAHPQFFPATDNTVSTMVKGEMVIDVPYGVDILWLRFRVMSVIPPFPFAYSTRMAFQPIYGILAAISKDGLVERSAKGRGMRLGWLSRSINRIRLTLRPKYVTWIVSTTHIIPQLVAQEVEKGFVMGMRLESTSSGYTVVDKSRLCPCEVPFGSDLDLLAVRE